MTAQHGHSADGADRRPKVSVVCAWFNRADYLRDTVDSLLAQDYGRFEIVLVNDGSSDPRVREILDGYADPRLRVIHQANTGFVGAIRRAIDESAGDYIAVMGAGDVALPARLRLQAAVLDADPGCVGLGSSFRNVTVDRDGSVLETVEHLRPRREVSYAKILSRAGSPFTHGEVMYRRAAYEAVGGYRAFFRFSQDMDLWLRLARLGYFTYCPEMLYERRIFNADGIQSDIRKTVVQLNFAHIAQECAREVDRRGHDFVEVFGAQAGMMMTPDRFATRLLAKTALKYLRAGELPEARFFADLAARGPATRVSVVARALVAMYEKPALRALAARAVAAMPILDSRELSPIPAVRHRD